MNEEVLVSPCENYLEVQYESVLSCSCSPSFNYDLIVSALPQLCDLRSPWDLCRVTKTEEYTATLGSNCSKHLAALLSEHLQQLFGTQLYCSVVVSYGCQFVSLIRDTHSVTHTTSRIPCFYVAVLKFFSRFMFNYYYLCILLLLPHIPSSPRLSFHEEIST